MHFKVIPLGEADCLGKIFEEEVEEAIKSINGDYGTASG